MPPTHDWKQNPIVDKARIVLGVFLIVSGFIILVILGSGWTEITKLGLAGEFMWVIVFCFLCLVVGFVIVFKERIDILTSGSKRGTPVEQATPLWAGIIIFATAIFCFIAGLLNNNIGSYILGIGLILVVVNGVLARTYKRYQDKVWRVAPRIIGVVVIAAIAIYYAFEKVNLLYPFLGITIAFFAFVLFARYRKKIKKYTVFQNNRP